MDKLTLRPEVAGFAKVMEQILRVNDHKVHWRDALTVENAFTRLIQEVAELAGAINGGDTLEITKEAADVANFAMMVADLVGGLEVAKRTGGDNA